MKHNSKSGFTLIELLVVIAIIAILAAILFPVFAQARQAARGTSSQSNLRQQALGIIMYTQDYDETFPMDYAFGSQGPVNLGGLPVQPWAWVILPYLKNVQIFADPLTVPIPGAYTPASTWYPYLTEYGYNYTALSPTPDISKSPSPRFPAALASIARPSSLVMLASHAGYGELSPNQYWSYGPGTVLTLGTVDPPDCGSIAGYCFDNWGAGGFWEKQSGVKDYEGGSTTGSVSLHKAGNGNFAFSDGHVKFMQPGQAAAGTNWSKTLPASQLKQTDKTQYMWAVGP